MNELCIYTKLVSDSDSLKSCVYYEKNAQPGQGLV